MSSDRLFIGCYPCGLVYADRKRSEYGDYKRLAFLSYSTLELEVSDSKMPKGLLKEIKAHADTIIAKKGQEFQVSTAGQTVALGK